MKLLKYDVRLLPLNILGRWHNQLGSVLTISELSRDGFLKGGYKSHVGTKGEYFKVNGVVNYQDLHTSRNRDLVISFMVKWGSYGSVTSWVGYFEEVNGVLYLKTKWNLVSPPKALDSGLRILSNTDVFTRNPHPLSRNLLTS